MSLKVKELPSEERPREKALAFGIDSLSNRELLAIILKTGCKNISVLEIADEILRVSGGISNLGKIELNELIRIKGIKEVKAIELIASLEFAKRVSYGDSKNKDVISNPESLIKWLQYEIGSRDQEYFMAVFLNVKNEVINYEIISKGTADSSLVHPRDVFKQAIKNNTNKIIIAHNHPSNNCNPSKADLVTTTRLVDSGNLLGINIIDHIIIGSSNYYSFKEHKLL
jgi:DNA repair protein RadC